jgi:hypothetical protein
VTDDWAAIRAALDSGAVRIYFPPTNNSYYSTKCFNLYKRYVLFGDSGMHGVVYNPVSRISFADNCVGFIVHYISSDADAYGYNNTQVTPRAYDARGTIFESLLIQRGNGEATTIDGVSHGIRLRTWALISNSQIRGFAGNGIHVDCRVTGGTNETHGNANRFTIQYTTITRCFHGVYTNNLDANVGRGIGVDCTTNAGWGIYDSTFLGNTWVGCHTANNGLGSYKTDDPNARSVFLGCYEEGGQRASIIPPSIHVGGLSEPGEGNAPKLSNICGEEWVSLAQNANVGEITVTSAGSGYTSSPAVTFDAPSGSSTATATATIGTLDFLNGKIVNISLTAGGAGYNTTPAVSVGGDGSGATAAAILDNGVVVSITVTDPGSGYTTAPVTVDAPTTTTALGTAYIDAVAGTLLHIVVTNVGAGYTVAPAITLTGGGGSGAAATCKLNTRAQSQCRVKVNEPYGGTGNLAYTRAFLLAREDVVSDGRGWCMKMYASSGNFRMDWGHLDAAVPFWVSGPKTDFKYGRNSPVIYGPWYPKGFWVGASSSTARNIFATSSIPTTGENAQGDFVFNTAPAIAGSPTLLLGWHRLTTGSAHVAGTDWATCYVRADDDAILTLANSATPSVSGGRKFITGGTTTITNFTSGQVGQEIIILSEHAITITDGTNIFLAGSANFVMANTDSLKLVQKADGKWYEIGRSVN